jgi:hypothetical protein
MGWERTGVEGVSDEDEAHATDTSSNEALHQSGLLGGLLSHLRLLSNTTLIKYTHLRAWISRSQWEMVELVVCGVVRYFVYGLTQRRATGSTNQTLTRKKRKKEEALFFRQQDAQCGSLACLVVVLEEPFDSKRQS